MFQNFRKIVKKCDDDMLPYLKRSIQATFVIIVIFYMTLLLHYRQRNIDDFTQQVKFLKNSALFTPSPFLHFTLKILLMLLQNFLRMKIRNLI